MSAPRRDRRLRDERGVVLPARLMVFSVSVVILAGLVFVATQSNDNPEKAAPAASRTTPSAPQVLPTKVPGNPLPSAKPAPVVRRGQIYVEVYNNSNIKGLAGKTASRAQAVGWNVVGSDNWYGTIDTSTVYFGPKFKAAAELLARDLGITAVKAAVAPMRFDRLTVILTASYH